MPSRFTSEKTLSSSRCCYLAKLHALLPHTSTLWMPDLSTNFSPLLTDFSTFIQTFPANRPYLSTTTYDMNVYPQHTWMSPHNTPVPSVLLSLLTSLTTRPHHNIIYPFLYFSYIGLLPYLECKYVRIRCAPYPFPDFGYLPQPHRLCNHSKPRRHWSSLNQVFTQVQCKPTRAQLHAHTHTPRVR